MNLQEALREQLYIINIVINNHDLLETFGVISKTGLEGFETLCGMTVSDLGILGNNKDDVFSFNFESSFSTCLSNFCNMFSFSPLL